MKREIVFRGKRIDNGEWVEGDLIIDRGYEPHNYYIQAKGGYQVDPETVGQFTGCKDKKKNKIFEGDILKGRTNNPFALEKTSYYEVMYGVDSWHIKGTSFSIQELFNYCNNDVIVVGNIHDNPELLNLK